MATKSKPRRSRKTTKKKMGIINKRNRSMTRRNRLNRVKRKKDKRLKDKTKMKKYKRGKNKTKRIKGGATEPTKLDQKFKFTLVKDGPDEEIFFGSEGKTIGEDILYLTDPCGSNFVGNVRKQEIIVKLQEVDQDAGLDEKGKLDKKFHIVYESKALHKGAGGASGSIYNSIFSGQRSEGKKFSIQRPYLYLIDVLYSEILTFKKLKYTSYGSILVPTLLSIGVDAYNMDELLEELRELRRRVVGKSRVSTIEGLFENMEEKRVGIRRRRIIPRLSTIEPVFEQIKQLLIRSTPFMALTPNGLQSTPIIKFYRNHVVPDDNDEKAICVIHQMGVDFRVEGNIDMGTKNLCRAYLNIRKCMELIASQGVTPKVYRIEQPCIVTYLSLGIFSGTINKQQLVKIAKDTMEYDQSGEASTPGEESTKSIRYCFSGLLNKRNPGTVDIQIPVIGPVYSEVYGNFDERLVASITAGINYFTKRLDASITAGIE